MAEHFTSSTFSPIFFIETHYKISPHPAASSANFTTYLYNARCRRKQYNCCFIHSYPLAHAKRANPTPGLFCGIKESERARFYICIYHRHSGISIERPAVGHRDRRFFLGFNRKKKKQYIPAPQALRVLVNAFQLRGNKNVNRSNFFSSFFSNLLKRRNPR